MAKKKTEPTKKPDKVVSEKNLKTTEMHEVLQRAKKGEFTEYHSPEGVFLSKARYDEIMAQLKGQNEIIGVAKEPAK